MKKLQLFDQKCQFCVLFKSMFILSRKACFLTTTSPNTFSGCGVFFLFRKACLLYKKSKIIFSRFIFTIYDMGIQGVTRDYGGLQGVTRGDRGLQGVTGGYKGL